MWKSHGFPRKTDEHCLQMVDFPHRTVEDPDGGGGINALHHLEGRPYVGPPRWGFQIAIGVPVTLW